MVLQIITAIVTVINIYYLIKLSDKLTDKQQQIDTLETEVDLLNDLLEKEWCKNESRTKKD